AITPHNALQRHVEDRHRFRPLPDHEGALVLTLSFLRFCEAFSLYIGTCASTSVPNENPSTPQSPVIHAQRYHNRAQHHRGCRQATTAMATTDACLSTCDGLKKDQSPTLLNLIRTHQLCGFKQTTA